MKSRKLIIALLLVFALVATSGTFAYWASSVSGPADGSTVGTVNVGSGDTVTTTITLTGSPATGGLLVPAGFAGSGEVESVDLVYGFEWTEDALATASTSGATVTGDLSVTYTITVIAADGVTDVTSQVGSLVNVTPASTFPLSITLDAAAQNLTWTVTLAEPSTQAEYDAIQNATITIDFTWSVSNVNIS